MAISRKSIVTGALILTAAGIVTRVLGFIYRIFMSNTMGAEGMGLYQLILPVYGLAWSISCAGFNTTVSKLTAQEQARGEYGNMGRILKQAVVITTALGAALSVLLYLGAQPLAVYFFKDLRVAPPLKILSLAFPFMAAGTCIRGYFIGLRETTVPAVNQVLEQLVRMAVVYGLAARFMRRGLVYACSVAVAAIVCEEIFSFIFIILNYKWFKKKYTQRPRMSSGQTLTLILSMALPLTANRVTGSALSAWENVLIPARLQAYGMSAAEAVSEFGRITGMAMPLIFFPTAVLTALSVTLVPAVSEAAATGHIRRVDRTASLAVMFAAITGMGAACLFVFFPDELGMAIYKQPIGFMLRMMGLMCPLIYLQIILSGILNGLGCQMFIFRNSVISSCISIGFIYFLVPRIGMTAYVLGWFTSLILVIALEIARIRQRITLELDALNWVAKPLLAAAAAGLSAKAIYARWLAGLGPRMGLAAAVTALMLLYIGAVALAGCVKKEELRVLTRHRG